MNAYERRQIKRVLSARQRKEQERQRRVAGADALIERFLNAYEATGGGPTVVTWNGHTGRYRWNGTNYTRMGMRHMIATLEAEAAGLVNPDEES